MSPVPGGKSINKKSSSPTLICLKSFTIPLAPKRPITLDSFSVDIFKNNPSLKTPSSFDFTISNFPLIISSGKTNCKPATLYNDLSCRG